MKRIERDAARNARRDLVGAAEIGDDDDLAGARQLRGDRLQLLRDLDRLAVVPIAVAAKNSFGSICPKRSSTPRSPKSGEQDEKIAPSEAAASMTATASGMFGSIAATRSPTPTPAARIACCRRETSARSSSQRQPPLDLVLAAEDERRLRARVLQQVLREIQPRVGKEARLPHRRGPRRSAPLALLADDAAEIPDEVPESARIARPTRRAARRSRRSRGRARRLRRRREARDRQRRRDRGIGRPERRVGHRLSRAAFGQREALPQRAGMRQAAALPSPQAQALSRARRRSGANEAHRLDSRGGRPAAALALFVLRLALVPREALKTRIGEQIAAWTGPRRVAVAASRRSSFFPR